MMQSFEQGATCQPLQVVTGFAQAYAANLHFANLEFVTNQVIEPHATRDHVTAGFTGGDVYAVIWSPVASRSITWSATNSKLAR